MRVLLLALCISFLSAVNAFASGCYTYYDFTLGKDVTVCEGSELQKIATDQLVQQDIIEDTLTRETSTYSTGEQSTSPSLRIIDKVKVFNIPYSYAIDESLKVSVIVPFIKMPGEFGLGNVGFTGNYLQGNFDEILWQSSITVITPTGDDKVGASDDFDFGIAQSALKNFQDLRAFGTVSYLTTSGDDILDLMVGADKDISNILGAYGYLSLENASSTTLLDTTVGGLYKLDADKVIRFGITVPTVTTGGGASNSDRDISFDVGMRFSL